MAITWSSRFTVVASIFIILIVMIGVSWGSGFGFRLFNAYAASSPKSSPQPVTAMIGDESLLNSGALGSWHANTNYIPATHTATGTPWNIVAKTGDLNLTGMGINVSVNSTGQVAFVGQTAAGESVFVGDGTNPPRIVSFAAPQTTRVYGSAVMINNNNQVIAIDRVPGPSYVLRVWDANNPAVTTVATGSQAGPTTSYSAILSFPALNNNVDASTNSKVFTVFSGLLRTASPPNDQVLVTPNQIPVTNVASSRNEVVLPTQRPMIADDGRVLIRAGSTSTSPIVLWNNSLTSATSIASASNFSALGQSPGISDDGKVVSFYGNLIAGNNLGLDPGVGIFAAVANNGNWVYKRIAGLRHNGYLDPGETYVDLNSNGNFDPPSEVDEGDIAGFFADDRVGVSKSGAVVFKATNQNALTSVFTNKIQPTTPTTPASAPQPLLVQGDLLSGLNSPVQAITLYDPISIGSNGGDNYAFWISLQDGTQAVVRTVRFPHPVVFIPGIAGSELVDGPPNGDNVWLGLRALPPFTQDRLRLTLFANEFPPGSSAIDATDAIRCAITTGCIYPVYKPILDFLASTGGYREYQVANLPSRRTFAGCDTSQDVDPNLKPNLFVFAYDWRKNNAQNADKLKEYLRCVELFWPGTKVDIVAHSMGGLVARRYIMDNAPDQRIDKLITIGSPWLGAPKAVYTVETGDFFEPIATGAALRHIAPSLPGAHQLLPSRAYELLGGSDVFAEEGWNYDGIGTNHDSYDYDHVRRFLNDKYPGTTPGTTGDTFHSHATSDGTQDDWTSDATGVKYFHFYGVRENQGQLLNDTTATTVAIRRPVCVSDPLGAIICATSDEIDRRYTIGDKTVPLLSASRRSNLGNLNAPNAKRFEMRNADPDLVEHNGLTRNPDVQNRVLTLLREGIVPSSPLSDALQVFAPSYYLSITGAASVVVSDTHGNSTAPVLGDLVGNVPGVSTFFMGNNAQGIVLPVSATESYSITFQTTGQPIAIAIVKGTDNVTPTDAIRYHDLNLPGGVAARLMVTTSQGAENLRYDSDGNGTFDTEVIPTVVASGPSASDVTAPTIAFSENPQSGGLSQVTIVTTDSASGVHDVSYSTDGTNFQSYTGPLSLDGAQTPILYAFATDNVGNRTSRISYTLIAPTAAGVSISGRLTNPGGYGIGGARVILISAQDGTTRSVRTGPFGYYGFDDVQVGETYILEVRHKLYHFSGSPRVMRVIDELTDVDFFGSLPDETGQSGGRKNQGLLPSHRRASPN